MYSKFWAHIFSNIDTPFFLIFNAKQITMKNIILLILFLINSLLFAQSKKEIIATQKTEIGMLKNMLSSLRIELDELGIHYDECFEDNDKITKELTSVSNEVSSLSNDLRDCNNLKTSQEDSLRKLTLEISELKNIERELVLSPKLFLIEDQSVMGFSLGGECPAELSLGVLTINKEIEDGRCPDTCPVDIYHFKLGEELLVKMESNQIYDQQTQSYYSSPEQVVNHITIFSDKFKTNKGIGIGSKLEDLVATHKDIEAWEDWGSGINASSYRSSSSIYDFDFELDYANNFDPYKVPSSKFISRGSGVEYFAKWDASAFPSNTKISRIYLGTKLSGQ